MPLFGRPSELIDIISPPPTSISLYLGVGFPSCASTVADLARTAPESDLPMLARAWCEPVRGPDALYMHDFNGNPATVVAMDIVN